MNTFRDNRAAVVGWRTGIGILGGLIGLGGTEFGRLPVLIGRFGFVAFEAVILNKATSLIVVAAALPFWAGTVPFLRIAARWDFIGGSDLYNGKLQFQRLHNRTFATLSEWIFRLCAR